MNSLRQAIEDSMNDIGLGTEERLDRAEERIRAVIAAEAPKLLAVAEAARDLRYAWDTGKSDWLITPEMWARLDAALEALGHD